MAEKDGRVPLRMTPGRRMSMSLVRHGEKIPKFTHPNSDLRSCSQCPSSRPSSSSSRRRVRRRWWWHYIRCGWNCTQLRKWKRSVSCPSSFSHYADFHLHLAWGSWERLSSLSCLPKVRPRCIFYEFRNKVIAKVLYRLLKKVWVLLITWCGRRILLRKVWTLTCKEVIANEHFLQLIWRTSYITRCSLVIMCRDLFLRVCMILLQPSSKKTWDYGQQLIKGWFFLWWRS